MKSETLFRKPVSIFIEIEDGNYISELNPKLKVSPWYIHKVINRFEREKLITTKKENAKRKIHLTEKGITLQKLFRELKGRLTED